MQITNLYNKEGPLEDARPKSTSGAAHDQLSKQASDWVLEAQLFVDGALYQDATFMRCDLNHTATCC